MSNDVVEIEQTLTAYCHRVDLGNADEVAELFASDALLLPKYDGEYRVEGRAAVREWYAYYHDNFRAGVKHLKHLIHSVSIEVDGDQATGVCYLTAYLISKEDGMAYQAQGTYFDQFVKIEGAWLIKQREINVEFLTQCGQPIEQLEPLGFETR